MLTIIEDNIKINGAKYCLCRCDCGNEKLIYRSSVIRGMTRSCGCLRKKTSKELRRKTNVIKEVKDGVATLITTNTNQEFYVDEDDLQRVLEHGSWQETNNHYIADSKGVYLHRFITNAPKGKVVDHKNHNRHDERKENLIICTAKENSYNRAVLPKGVSQFSQKGRTYYKVQLLGKSIGVYTTETEAQEVRNQIVQSHYNWGEAKI